MLFGSTINNKIQRKKILLLNWQLFKLWNPFNSLVTIIRLYCYSKSPQNIETSCCTFAVIRTNKQTNKWSFKSEKRMKMPYHFGVSIVIGNCFWCTYVYALAGFLYRDVHHSHFVTDFFLSFFFLANDHQIMWIDSPRHKNFIDIPNIGKHFACVQIPSFLNTTFYECVFEE